LAVQRLIAERSATISRPRLRKVGRAWGRALYKLREFGIKPYLNS
jgi:hypothetical protein